jgi:hypothetical protein
MPPTRVPQLIDAWCRSLLRHAHHHVYVYQPCDEVPLYRTPCTSRLRAASVLMHMISLSATNLFQEVT